MRHAGYPEHIATEMRKLFADLRTKRYLRGLSHEAFVRDIAAFISTLNAIYPFREGNGRTQTTFLTLLAAQASYPLDLDRLEPEKFLDAMIRSYKGDDVAIAK